MRSRRAFSLIELLVVVSVIAILAAILLPTISMVRASAQTAQCASNMRQIGLAFHTYATEQEGFIPYAQYIQRDRDALGLPYWGVWFGGNDHHHDGHQWLAGFSLPCQLVNGGSPGAGGIRI